MGDNRINSTDSRECFSTCIRRNEFISRSDIV
ncbi:MAG: S26 family signal peptidase [Candidatus Peribacteria bacterium]|nr:S26 family signal peptidase [Candidatus Peribacteria bacterium]